MPMAVPQRSTPYFSALENVEILQLQNRERSPRRVIAEPKSSGQVVEGCSKFCCEHSQIIRGHNRGCLGESSIKMNLCSPYKEEDLEKWTKATKFKIWKAAQSEWTDEDRQQLSISNETGAPVLNAATLFNKNNLILSWMDSKSLDCIGELSPKVNLVFHFACLDDCFEWEKWAQERNVLLVHQDPFGFNGEDPSQQDQQDFERHSFGSACKDTINTLANFLRLAQCCPVCKKKRIIHAVFVCDGTSKSVCAFWQTLCLSITVMQTLFCLIFCISDEFGSLCLSLITHTY